MKKIILSVAILASGVSTFAFANNVLPVQSINIVMNEEFTEISVEELPEAVKAAVKKDFETATIAKAYTNGSEQYKLELTVDGTTNIAYVDKDGNWLKEDAIK